MSLQLPASCGPTSVGCSSYRGSAATQGLLPAALDPQPDCGGSI